MKSVAWSEALLEVWRTRHKTNIDYVAAEKPAFVRIAPERLAQVLENLVDNAVSFSPDGESVRLEVGFVENDVRICGRGSGARYPL